MASKLTRRSFLNQTGKSAAALAVTGSLFNQIAMGQTATSTIFDDILFTQKPLSFSFNGLEPFIDEQTMNIHYSKHGATYLKNLLEACMAEKISIEKKSVFELVKEANQYTTKLKNNVGGHFNHELFWRNLSPANDENTPQGKLLEGITQHFGSLDGFKSQFTDMAKSIFGSGWAWLVVGKNRTLSLRSTANQENPLMETTTGLTYPLLGLDVWEHAYYLKHQNKRIDYINDWWNVVNWKNVEKNYGLISTLL